MRPFDALRLRVPRTHSCQASMAKPRIQPGTKDLDFVALPRITWPGCIAALTPADKGQAPSPGAGNGRRLSEPCVSYAAFNATFSALSQRTGIHCLESRGINLPSIPCAEWSFTTVSFLALSMRALYLY
jgi:hypothetical protein